MEGGRIVSGNGNTKKWPCSRKENCMVVENGHHNRGRKGRQGTKLALLFRDHKFSCYKSPILSTTVLCSLKPNKTHLLNEKLHVSVEIC